MKFTEKDIRDMRDKVYGHKSSDENWKQCREYWMKDSEINWLVKEVNKLKKS
jgi:hypothetical protein